MRTLPPVEVFGLEYSFSPRVGVILVVPASSPTMLGIYLVLFFKSFHLGVLTWHVRRVAFFTIARRK